MRTPQSLDDAKAIYREEKGKIARSLDALIGSRVLMAVLATFVIAFAVLGYYGTQTVTPTGTLISQIGTLIYFAFFLLMPWYSVMDRTQPEPDRVTM